MAKKRSSQLSKGLKQEKTSYYDNNNNEAQKTAQEIVAEIHENATVTAISLKDALQACQEDYISNGIIREYLSEDFLIFAQEEDEEASKETTQPELTNKMFKNAASTAIGLGNNLIKAHPYSRVKYTEREEELDEKEWDDSGYDATTSALKEATKQMNDIINQILYATPPEQRLVVTHQDLGTVCIKNPSEEIQKRIHAYLLAQILKHQEIN